MTTNNFQAISQQTKLKSRQPLSSSSTLSFLLLLAQAITIGLVFSFIFTIIILLTSSAQANSHIKYASPDEVGQGSLLSQQADGHYTEIPLLNTHVKFTIAGLFNQAQVSQEFNNNTGENIEAIYVFPLPENAIVNHFKVILDDEIIVGKIMEKQQAQQVYQQAKQSGKKTALLQRKRPNIFQTKIANIKPNSQVSVIISYQQQVDYSNYQYSLRFPMVVGPRYTPTHQTLLKEEIKINTSEAGKINNTIKESLSLSNPISTAEEKINPVTIDISLDSGFALQNINSPTHLIQINPPASTSVNSSSEKNLKTLYHIAFKNNETSQVKADRDFVLQWQLEKSEQIRAATFTQQDPDDANSFYLNMMLMPPEKLYQQTQRLSKEMILVLDTSGSMDGTSIIQARQAVIDLLQNMQQGDSFNIIEFNHQSTALFSDAVAVNQENINDAINFVSHLRADGGTEMKQAMLMALNHSIKKEKKDIRQVIFVTDGNISNENELFSIIKNQLDQSRLFTIGIGSAPNSYFMRKAAEFGRGSFTYINNINEVASKMQDLFKKLQSPLLSNIQITWPEYFNKVDIYPKQIQDLYLGKPLIINAKVSLAKNQASSHNIKVSGQSASTLWESLLNIENIHRHQNISNLWAKEKISTLSDLYFHPDDPNQAQEQLKQQVIELSIAHNVLSQFTSFVAVSEQVIKPENKQAIKKLKLAQNLPYGWTNKGLTTFPQTATIAPLLLLISASLLFVTFLLWSFREWIVSSYSIRS